jgi:hypothetical protein
MYLISELTVILKLVKKCFMSYSLHDMLSHLHGECFVAPHTKSESISVNVDCIKVEDDPLQIENE